MKIEIENPGPPVDQAVIEEIESKLSAKLPSEYCVFLQRTNGGQPWPDTIDVKGLVESPTDVSVIFGIGREVKTSNLGWIMETYKGIIGAGFLPIAADSGGNLFGLCFRNEEHGTVSYINLLKEKPMFYRVADSFNCFLDLIH